MQFIEKSNSRNWENIFITWSQGPGATEQEKCDRAIKQVKQAIDNDSKLTSLGIKSFAQGSYRNRTNITKESDVDVCALYEGTFYSVYRDGITREELGLTDATYKYTPYKNDVENSLVTYFGRSNVKRGNKAFDINENTYRVDADAVACFGYRIYYRNSTGLIYYHSGTALITDKENELVTSFPEQQYQNGIKKHEATKFRFKKTVRIFKHLKNEMEVAGIQEAEPMASFLLESLVWNAPDLLFFNDSFTDIVKSILKFIWAGTETDYACSSWMEENNIKNLFSSDQKWTREQVRSFVDAAWKYINN